MKIKRQKHGLYEIQEEMLETSNAECAWTKQEQFFSKGIKITVIKKKLLGKSPVHRDVSIRK